MIGGFDEESDARREVLKAGSTAAVTAILSPLIGNAGREKENSNMRNTALARTPSEEICFTEVTALVELLRTKKVLPWK